MLLAEGSKVRVIDLKSQEQLSTIILSNQDAQSIIRSTNIASSGHVYSGNKMLRINYEKSSYKVYSNVIEERSIDQVTI